MAEEEQEEQDIVVWGDNEGRIKTIQSWFAPGSANLMKPNRILVGEGVLLKQCRKKLKPRQFFLFNDIFVYANIILTKKKYNQQRILNLSEISVEGAEDEKGIQILTPSRSFLVFTATPEEAREWILHINMCINSLPNKPNSRPPSAALWVPDTATEKCMLCNNTKFTTFNRRHHCRKCGKVVCGGCSSKKMEIQTISTKPQRVCDLCFQSSNQKSGSEPAIETKVEDKVEDKMQTDEKEKKLEKDFESEDELALPKIEVQKSDSDEDEDEEITERVRPTFQENVRTSVFFTDEQNKRISFIPQETES